MRHSEIRPNYVAGEWRVSSTASTNENPSDLDSQVGQYAQAMPEDVADAAEAAASASARWAAATPTERATVLATVGDELKARAEELGRLLSEEEGKVLAEGVGEVRRAADIFHYYAAEAYRSTGELLPSVRPGVEIEVRRQPVGVVGVITPWNFPMAIPAWKIAPALAYGNCVLFKPADLTPGCAWELTDILDRAKIPPGVFNLVMGPGSTVGEAVITDARVHAVTFTGSNQVGRRVAAAAVGRLAKVQLELGGKNSIIVLDDADLDKAVAHVINGAFLSTGQRCTASSRIVATAGVHDRLVDMLAEKARELRVGHALAADSQIGPVVDAKQLDKDLEYIDIGRGEGATVLVEGGQVERGTRGHFLTPTLFVDTAADMRINREEMFGPIAAVIRAEDYDEALAIANDTEYGLVGAIMTKSLKHADHFKRQAQVGMAMVNLPTVGQEFQAPFGGAKSSSYGAREQGEYAKEFFTNVRTAYVNSD